jgi:hypothetical protein
MGNRLHDELSEVLEISKHPHYQLAGEDRRLVESDETGACRGTKIQLVYIVG